MRLSRARRNDPYVQAALKGVATYEGILKDRLSDEADRVVHTDASQALAQAFKLKVLELWWPEGGGIEDFGPVLLASTSPPAFPERDEPQDEPMQIAIAKLRTPTTDMADEPNDGLEDGLLESMDGRFAEHFQDAETFGRSLRRLLERGSTAKIIWKLVADYRAARQMALTEIRSVQKVGISREQRRSEKAKS